MKKLLILTIGITSFLNYTIFASADYTVVPAPPYERQFNIEAEPGSKQSASVIIKNIGNKAVRLNLYGADATQSAQGTFALTTNTTEQRHIGTWITFEKPEITVPAGEEITVPFILQIPDSTTPGSYAGGIAVENMNGFNGETTKETPSVSISSRFIVRIYVSIPGEKIHQYKWKDFSYSYSNENNHAKFTFDISNTGNTIILVDPKVELDGFPSLKQPIIELPTATIQPGTQSQKIDLRLTEKPPAGFYLATGTLTFSELDIVNNKKINSKTESRQFMINLTPWYFIAIIIIVILALILTPLILYFRYKTYYKKCVSYTVAENDTVITIANKRGVKWKKITKLNKLKPPYTLKVGQHILIPPKKK